MFIGLCLVWSTLDWFICRKLDRMLNKISAPDVVQSPSKSCPMVVDNLGDTRPFLAAQVRVDVKLLDVGLNELRR